MYTYFRFVLHLSNYCVSSYCVIIAAATIILYLHFSWQWENGIFSALNTHSSPLQPHGIRQERIFHDVIDIYSNHFTAMECLFNVEFMSKNGVDAEGLSRDMLSGKMLTATSLIVDHFFHLQCM